ncbi:uncharacterized protein LOC111357194 isoform X2 [Spodoptera litura]|uniref:Uncharacterized protein LOC111357194 isoform X2 n=1 Tax=Spodoptera litura TaxID=69820 RepID=A0A9J7EFI0_SPOLT|nr:uncharacterized protein LOC111357194 isoform X2 [Spodoptera litura]
MYKYIVLITVASAVALPNPGDDGAVDKVRGIKKDCANGLLSPGCLKMGAITLLEKLNNKDEVSLIPGVSLVKDGSKTNYEAVAADLARSLSTDSDDRLDKSLLYHIGSFLDSHSVKLRLLDDNAVEEAKTAIAEGRGKGGMGLGGKKGGMGGLLAMGMMMKGTLMSMGLGALALLAGKALMTAMMSLLLSAIIGIKSLSGGKGSTTYEIVSKPIYTHSHSHSTAHEDVGGYGHSGYGRSMNVRRR